ncbi:uncharacterized protein V1518DRAFT_421594 [Limtongia smithiae]|uniref:uncharacterized protein n=1 Tax=Limtongia smithiae TaxID=1125753 RepID=UPI0034CFC8E7
MSHHFSAGDLASLASAADDADAEYSHNNTDDNNSNNTQSQEDPPIDPAFLPIDPAIDPVAAAAAAARKHRSTSSRARSKTGGAAIPIDHAALYALSASASSHSAANAFPVSHGPGNPHAPVAVPRSPALPSLAGSAVTAAAASTSAASPAASSTTAAIPPEHRSEECHICGRIFRGPKSSTHKQQHIRRLHPDEYQPKRGGKKRTVLIPADPATSSPAVTEYSSSGMAAAVAVAVAATAATSPSTAHITNGDAAQPSPKRKRVAKEALPFTGFGPAFAATGFPSEDNDAAAAIIASGVLSAAVDSTELQPSESNGPSSVYRYRQS